MNLTPCAPLAQGIYIDFIYMEQPEKIYKILLSGGGTGGSVAPLLAAAEELKNLDCHFDRREKSLIPGAKTVKGFLANARNDNSREVCEFEFFWLGTKFGPERTMVERSGIKFRAICGGKWRRYFSLKNLVDILKIKIGFWQALWIMLKWRPNLVMSAGSFVSVPVIWAAWLLHVPVLIHQQDVQPGLANRLMALLAKVITVTFKKSLADYGKKAVWTGNPVRQSIKNLNSKHQIPNLNENSPIVLVVGGGTGAEAINNLVMEGLNELTRVCQIIHVFGRQKGVRIGITNYFAYEFLDEERIAGALKSADVVVTRAGLGFLTELSYLNKPAIIIPMPNSHQLANAAMFKEAAIVLEQKNLTVGKFIAEIKNLINNEKLQKELGEKMGRVMKKGANQAMVKIIAQILNPPNPLVSAQGGSASG